MDNLTSADDKAFRDEVRAFIDAELSPDLRAAGRACAGIYCDYPDANRWHRILARRGWSVPSWPVEYGGTGWTPKQQYVFDREMATAGAPLITPNSTRFVAPVIIAFGTAEQKARYLPAIRSGDDWWAQGYSEPGSGSDLASLRCSAVRDGDDFIVNGSKIWTTHAHFSNRIFCLVRTKTDGRPQAGISFLLFDLDLPGVEIRPIISMSGEHELNEVFFRDVRVPHTALLGAENEGWAVAKYLLQHERSGTWTPLLRARLVQLRARALDVPGDGVARMIDDPGFLRRLAEVETFMDALEVAELRMLTGADHGRPVSSLVSSMMKVQGTELRQRLTELSVAVAGRSAWVAFEPGRQLQDVDLDWGVQAMSTYLNDRAASIYGGTNEVQRNIIARAVLADGFMEGGFSPF